MSYTIDLSYYLMIVRPMLVKYSKICDIEILEKRVCVILLHVLLHDAEVAADPVTLCACVEKLLFQQLFDLC